MSPAHGLLNIHQQLSITVKWLGGLLEKCGAHKARVFDILIQLSDESLQKQPQSFNNDNFRLNWSFTASKMALFWSQFRLSSNKYI